jgi:predicted Zn-dependent protease
LRNWSINDAEADLRLVLKIRQNDPLAMYFRGELLHAQHKDVEAIAAFNAVLKIWPEFAPALSATARLIAAKNAPKQILETAISMSERAAHIEPMNLTYWNQTADLYDRAGQRDRAEAIRLQWLNRPQLPTGKK